MNWRSSWPGVGVRGKAPGMDSFDLLFSRSFSLGTAPASAAVDDSGAAEESVWAGSSTMSSGRRMLLTIPWPSSSLGAVSLIHQLPLTTNYAPLLAGVCTESCLPERRAGAPGGRRQARVAQWTHLILCLGLGQLDGLLEDAALLLELDGLLPIVEGAGHVNVVGVMFPADRELSAQCDSRRATHHVNVYLPMAA